MSWTSPIDGGQHDGALGDALLALQVGLELGDRLLHHLGRLQHERQDQLAGAELVADLLHRRQQHVVEHLDGVAATRATASSMSASTPSFLRWTMR